MTGEDRSKSGSTVPYGVQRTLTAAARNPAGFIRLLDAIDQDNPDGDLAISADNLSSHFSGPVREWLSQHPRLHLVCIPVGACWLNRQEGWWRWFRHEAFAG